MFSPSKAVKKENAQSEQERFLGTSDSAFESSEPEKKPEKTKKTPRKKFVRDEGTPLRRSARINKTKL